ncbi:MAG: Asp-tRNA(Asn)/Glu-tRNA(Gln) amidotransferase subunit GatB [Endomicrobium sp.]|jgi:aspartyl-tRNA(Asn)/glutamyl-tRNA(Gln) amidotransferase subunit B|nr:Asp-tRNA(Asn)/Glu-tRNA(Gln) amidotransferase subunit GatB [Endomicrobium sp.]
MFRYEVLIGLEVHMQINTKSKIFCECSTQFGAEANSNICVICTSQPGVIPILNKKAVEGVIKTGLALNFTINRRCTFARKQYFYPDVPKNYQITQFESPLCSNGKLSIIVNEREKIINIERIHLEEDTGKLLHKIGGKKLNYSLLDLNRAGIGLMELVTKPELSSPQEAVEFLRELKNIVEYLDTSECNMEEGKMRCDVNVSVRIVGQKKLGVRVEIKNMNSISGVKDAITYEVQRHKKILNSGARLVQETRFWDAEEKVTKSMRLKENILDYRYFTEPDLVPLYLSNCFIENLYKQLPELPRIKKARFIKNYNLSEYDASYLTSSKMIAEYYEDALSNLDNKNSVTKLLANWISTELSAKLNASKICITKSPISSKNLSKLISLIQNEIISGKIAKIVFEEMYEKSIDPEIIIKKRGFTRISDESVITEICEKAIIESPNAVAEFKIGKKRAIDAIIGLVMKKSKGQADPKLVNKILIKKLN